MVQIGNESTPGILIHLCDSGGLPLAGIAGYNAVNGAIYLYSSTDGGAPPAGGPAAGGWANLGMLLNAAVKGVKDVDTGIMIALHLDRGNDLASSRNFIHERDDPGRPVRCVRRVLLHGHAGPALGLAGDVHLARHLSSRT